MKDSIENNGAIYCSEHAPKPGNYTHLKPEFFVDKFVKKAFPVENNPKFKVEHMWVHVTGTDGDTLIGHLNNDPWLVDMKNGDSVRMTIDEVELVEGIQ